MMTSMPTPNWLNEKSGQNKKIYAGPNSDAKIVNEAAIRNKQNPKIKEYWKKLFGKDNLLSEKELVMRILKHHQKEPTAENMTIALGKIFRDVYRHYLEEQENHHYSIRNESNTSQSSAEESDELKIDKSLLESEDLSSNLKFWVKIWYLELVDLDRQGIRNTPLRSDYNIAVQAFNDIRTTENLRPLDNHILKLRELFYSKYVQQKDVKDV